MCMYNDLCTPPETKSSRARRAVGSVTKIDTLTHTRAVTRQCMHAGNLALLIWMKPNCVRGSRGGDDCILAGSSVDGSKCYRTQPLLCRRRRSIKMPETDAFILYTDEGRQCENTPLTSECVTHKLDCAKIKNKTQSILIEGFIAHIKSCYCSGIARTICKSHWRTYSQVILMLLCSNLFLFFNIFYMCLVLVFFFVLFFIIFFVTVV